jgi:hypothetical protein
MTILKGTLWCAVDCSLSDASFATTEETGVCGDDSGI